MPIINGSCEGIPEMMITDLPSNTRPTVKCCCGLTISGYISGDAERILKSHECPKTLSNNSAGIILMAICAIPAIAYVIVRIWGH